MTRKVLITLLLLGLAYGFLFHFLLATEFDKPSFVGGARMMFGLDGAYDFQSRVTKPLPLIIPGFMEWAFGIHPSVSFIAQNVVFFFLSGLYFYKSSGIIFKDDNVAYLSMLMYITCQPFAVYSLLVLADVPGWFFGIYAIYLTLKMHIDRNLAFKKLALIGFWVGVGCSVKESAAVGIIYLFCYVLFLDNTFILKMKQWTVALAGFLVPFIVSFVVVEYFFHDSVVKRLFVGYDLAKNDTFMLSQLKQIYRVVDVYWFVFLLGLYFVMNQLCLRRGDIIMKTMLLSFILSSILVPIWPCFMDRLLFMVAPFIIIIATYGVAYFKKYSFLTVALGGFLNISTTFLIYRFSFQGMIPLATIIFVAILLILASLLYRENGSFFNREA